MTSVFFQKLTGNRFCSLSLLAIFFSSRFLLLSTFINNMPTGAGITRHESPDCSVLRTAVSTKIQHRSTCSYSLVCQMCRQIQINLSLSARLTGTFIVIYFLKNFFYEYPSIRIFSAHRYALDFHIPYCWQNHTLDKYHQIPPSCDLLSPWQ